MAKRYYFEDFQGYEWYVTLDEVVREATEWAESTGEEPIEDYEQYLFDNLDELEVNWVLVKGPEIPDSPRYRGPIYLGSA